MRIDSLCEEILKKQNKTDFRWKEHVQNPGEQKEAEVCLKVSKPGKE